jgi:hypothetical protein
MFDPYHKWLGIPRDQRPPTYYQLLGISADEEDPEVIEEAAIRQTAHLRTYQNGPQAHECVRLLNEIAQARTTLLSPARRQAYDARLRTARPEPTVQPAAESQPFDPLGDLADGRSPAVAVVGRSRSSARRGIRVRSLVVFALLHVVSIGLLVWFFFLRTTDQPKQVAQATHPAPKPAPKIGEVEKPVRNVPGAGEEPPGQPRRPMRDPAKDPAKDPDREEPRAIEKEADSVKPSRPQAPPRQAEKVERPSRTPIPADAVLAKAREMLRERFQRFPREKPTEITALAREMFQLARETDEDRAVKYAALQEVQDLAVQTGDVAEALRAVSLLGRCFEMDTLTRKADVLERILGRDSDTIRKEVAESAAVLVGEALDGDHLGAAKRLLDLAVGAAKKARLSKLEKQLAERVSELEARAKAVQEFQTAQETLRTRPEDAAANLTVGRYLCLRKGDWKEGLPRLAHGEEAGLKELAKKDLRAPRDARSQLEVGEGWLDLAKAEARVAKTHLLQRAGYWFEKAAAEGTGTTQAAAVKRLKELAGKALADLHVRPASFDGRVGRAREILFWEGGGNEQADAAVARGLRWLTRHQDPRTGGWSLNRFNAHAGCTCTGTGEENDIAATALALLAFLGDGQTQVRGYYAANVDRGLKFLIARQARQKPAGYFGGGMYAHALATTAVCEAYGLTHDDKLRLPARAALQLIVASQNKTGGWRYQPRSPDGDTSVTGWQILALKSGELAGISIPAVTWKRAGQWLESCMQDGGAAYSYQVNGPTGPTTSAIGLVCRAYMGSDLYQEAFRAGVARLRSFPPPLTSQYYNYYATLLMHHVGGEDGTVWNRQMRDLLVASQEKGDPQLRHPAGSWDPLGDLHARQGGRIMVTTLALLNLEACYRSVPLSWRGSAVPMD